MKALKVIYKLLAGSIGQKVAWGILLAVLYLQYSNTPLLDGFRNRSFDIYQRLAPREVEGPSPVGVIAIDEKSMKALGQWPWSRDLIAELVRRVTRAGAVVVGFDVVFSEKDRLSAPLLAKTLQGLDQETRLKLSAMRGNDEKLAIRMAQSRVVLGGFVTNDEGVIETNTLEKLPSINWIGKDPKRFVKPALNYVGNVAEIEKTAAGFSNFSLDSDFDGVIRRIPLLSRVNDKLIPMLGLEILRVATGQNIVIKANENGIEGVVVARTIIPTDGFGRMWIRYSEYDPTNYVSAIDILSGEFQPKDFAGKLVLLGATATGLKDIRSTPVNSTVPGVEVHVQMLQTVLNGDHLYRGDLMRAIEWLVILIAGMLLIVFVPKAGARTTFLGLAAAIALAMGVASYLYLEQSVLMDITFFLAATISMYIVLVYSSFRSVEQQRSMIKSAFAHYLSPAMVSKLADSPEQLTLGGEVRTMTFLFCDIRGFTAISEQFGDNPEGLTELINDFLTPMTDIIMKHGGTIDKYMGDCIMAFWNAPLDDPDHAENAIKATREMHVELERVNEREKIKALDQGRQFIPIKIGIGVNTGKCVVGNMGSEQRFDYSVLGDAVNLASRLEGQCKTYGMHSIVGEDTVAMVEDHSLLEIDLIAVKGKSAAIHIFGCLDDSHFPGKFDYDLLWRTNGAMIKEYRAQNWDGAEKLVEKCLNIAPELSILYRLYLERIADYRENDPGSDWTGVYTATSK